MIDNADVSFFNFNLTSYSNDIRGQAVSNKRESLLFLLEPFSQ